jgi:hypothetical protein
MQLHDSDNATLLSLRCAGRHRLQPLPSLPLPLVPQPALGGLLHLQPAFAKGSAAIFPRPPCTFHSRLSIQITEHTVRERLPCPRLNPPLPAAGADGLVIFIQGTSCVQTPLRHHKYRRATTLHGGWCPIAPHSRTAVVPAAATSTRPSITNMT